MRNKITYFQILDEIYSIIHSRKKTKKRNSYTYKILKLGNKKIAQKVAEESSELIIDFLNGAKKRTTEEASDLLYHIMLLLYAKNILPSDIAKELRSRYKK